MYQRKYINNSVKFNLWAFNRDGRNEQEASNFEIHYKSDSRSSNSLWNFLTCDKCIEQNWSAKCVGRIIVLSRKMESTKILLEETYTCEKYNIQKNQ